jgi:Leucine-rich repeat (LRR) protein
LLPASLANLTKLRRLDVSNNHLSGVLPQKFGTGLMHIQELLLGNNEFTGTIPSTWISMSSLAHLEIQNNQLSGSLPINYQKWTKLTGLYIQNNPALFGE